MIFSAYRTRYQNEVAHYQEIFKDTLFQAVPPVWGAVEAHFAQQIQAATGVTGLPEYIARFARGRKRLRVLSLGSGSCGVELVHLAPLLKKQGTELNLTSLDINETVLAQAAEEAEKRQVTFIPMVQDINKLVLPAKAYDVVLAFASLHHFIKLDLIARAINTTLTPRGIFVTVDIPTRRGYRMWKETKAIVDHLWTILPPKYKFDHTAQATVQYAATYPDVDYARHSFECANSEAILPALHTHLREVVFVPAYALARRFFDTKFGPNYDLRLASDRAVFDFIMTLDDYYLQTQQLQPETFFGVYRKRL